MKETMQFQAESKQLLSLMINSIYTNKEIFLRELISNASDAIDKYRYLSISSQGKTPTKEHFIRIELNKDKRYIKICDNGIGMSKEDLINNLGTIAKSGSKDFLEKFKKAKDEQDLNIIGQFGVGFYSAFMVANKIEVISKTIDEDKAHKFTSDGVETYTIEDVEKDDCGTDVIVYLKKSTKEEEYDQFLNEYTIENLVRKYSDYIRYPIKMMVKKSVQDVDENNKPIEGKYHDVIEDKVLNSMTPIWKKNKKDVSQEELDEFYKNKFSDFEKPLINLFVSVEGMLDYKSLIFIPSHAPYNLYSENYEKGLMLYAKGIFIKDKCPELVPDYLKFIRGLVDSDDFNLNISREMLQSSPIMTKIANNIEKKIIEKLKEVKENDFETYRKFFDIYGEHIKYGIYSSYGGKKDLLQDLLIFHSLKHQDDMISLKQYKDEMKKEQKFIYFAPGETLDQILLLPQMEKYRKDEIDVLLLDKKIDEFAIMMLMNYDKVEFKSISSDDTESLSEEQKTELDSLTATHKRLLDNLKEGLKDSVDEVVLSSKLVDAPVCISTKEGLSLSMEKTLNEQPGVEKDQQIKSSKVLEINPNHELFKALATIDDDQAKKYASILYDEALMLEGFDIKDKKDFITKLNELLVKSFNK